jgi:hypothetical protein
MINLAYVFLTIFLSIATVAITTFGPEGNKVFYFGLSVAAVFCAIITAYFYGYIQCRKASTGITKVHQISDAAQKVKVVEFDDEGALLATHEYVADKGWLSGYRKIIYK